MSEEKVEMSTIVTEEMRDYLENKNVKLEYVIAEWIKQDKECESGQSDEIIEKIISIHELEKFISIISKIQDECYNEINKLRIEIKEFESNKEEDLT